MGNREEVQHIPIAYKGFSGFGLIKINAVVEISSFASDVIFVEICNLVQSNNRSYFDTKNSISMLMNVVELRAVAYAIKEHVEVNSNKENGGFLRQAVRYMSLYQNFTNSGKTKIFRIYYQEKDMKIQLSMIQDGGKGSNKDLVTFIKMSPYEALGLCDSMFQIANLLEKKVFYYQQQMLIKK